MKTTPQDVEEWGIAVGLGALSIPIGFLLKLIPVGQSSPVDQNLVVAAEERKPLLSAGHSHKGGKPLGGGRPSGYGSTATTKGKEKEAGFEMDLEAPGDDNFGWGGKKSN